MVLQKKPSARALKMSAIRNTKILAFYLDVVIKLLTEEKLFIKTMLVMFTRLI